MATQAADAIVQQHLQLERVLVAYAPKPGGDSGSIGYVVGDIDK